MSVTELISTFEDTSVYHASIIKFFLARVNNFSLSSKPSNENTSVLERLNILSYIFENVQMLLSET